LEQLEGTGSRYEPVWAAMERLMALLASRMPR
jgi:hypothetical protein